MSRILVVGGAGYIGSHVVRSFLDKEYDVAVYDNMSSGCVENLFQEAAFINGDILNYEQLSQTMRTGFDGVVHLAAFKAAGESMIKPEKYSINNITGTLNILNSLSETGIKNIVFSSSAAVYGNPEYVPVDEKHPVNPINYYGFTKLEIERFLDWYGRLKGINYAALRYFNAAGYDIKGRISGLERNPANLLPVLMEVAAGIRQRLSIFGDDYDTPDGTCIRDYVHVNDLASAHVLAMEYLFKNQSITLNLGSENGISVKEMLDVSRQVTGQEIPADITSRRLGDPEKLVASSEKAQAILGWKAEYSDAFNLVKSTWDVYNKIKRA
jgi:UDP-glucose 4-epimerase